MPGNHIPTKEFRWPDQARIGAKDVAEEFRVLLVRVSRLTCDCTGAGTCIPCETRALIARIEAGK